MQFWFASQTSVADAPHPLGRAARDRLLNDQLALDARVPAPQVQRPVAHVRQHRRRDLRVVLGEVGLGDPVGREQQLAGIADPDSPPAGAHRSLRGHAGTLTASRRHGGGAACNNLSKG
jgi:hypothetical protein